MKVCKAEGSEIEIPELDEAMKSYAPKKNWSEKEIAILSKYYQKVPTSLLVKYLPGRTVPAIKQKAEMLLLHKRTD